MMLTLRSRLSGVAAAASAPAEIPEALPVRLHKSAEVAKMVRYDWPEDAHVGSIDINTGELKLIYLRVEHVVTNEREMANVAKHYRSRFRGPPLYQDSSWVWLGTLGTTKTGMAISRDVVLSRATREADYGVVGLNLVVAEIMEIEIPNPDKTRSGG